MKHLFKIALISILVSMIFTSSNAQEKRANNSPKILIAYFSWSGNTRVIANYIKDLTGGDITEIKSVKPYSKDYNTCVEEAKKDKEDNVRPLFKSDIKSIEKYDIILIGFPNWWGTMPMPMWTFLESLNFSGKIVAPFCTHGGGGKQECFKDFEKETNKAAVHKSGFIRSGSGVDKAKPFVEKWLKARGVI